MKFSKIALAAAAVLAGNAAFAIPASSYTNTGEFTGDTLNIRISGATAQDNGVLGSALSFCLAGTLTRYAISNDFAFYCTPDIGTAAGQLPAAAFPGGRTKLAIYKHSFGGSGAGVGPLNSNSATDGSTGGTYNGSGNQLPFLDLSKLAASCTGTNAVTTTVTFNTILGSYTNVACGNASSAVTTLATTYIGLSDVEPAFFVPAAARNNLSSTSIYGLIFGAPVTLNIRNALQTQQGLTVGDDTEANMPSLSSAQLTSAYTQVGQTWAGIGVTSGLVDDTIYVARRVDSSGTQKSFEILFARSPNGQAGQKNCFNGTNPFVPTDSAVGQTTGDSATLCSAVTPPVIFGGSGGGDVRNCLINHNNAGRGAIGILTTEDKAGANPWRFVKVDGVTPNQAQTAAGKYRHYVESFMNTRTAGAFATSAALSYSTFVSRLSADLANPAIIKAINGADQTFGPAGLMALYARQSPAPALDFTGATSVVPLTKAAGAASDNCQAPAVFF